MKKKIKFKVGDTVKFQSGGTVMYGIVISLASGGPWLSSDDRITVKFEIHTDNAYPLIKCLSPLTKLEKALK
jgi:uncharacterized protein YodC (DUF2158 family)